MTMRILITGGTGFIGSRLALECLKRGYTVKILGQVNTAAESKCRSSLEKHGAVVSVASVTDQQAVFKSLENTDVVFHLAAVQHEMNIPDQKFWDVNVSGTKNVLEGSVKAGVKRFVYGSTIGVYGALEGMIHDHSPCNPDNIYGITKLEGEKLVLSFKDALGVTAVRIPETYGPGDYRLLKLFKAIKSRMFFMIGNGENMHHLIYIDDLVEGFLKTATSDYSLGKVFLFSGKEAVKTKQMISEIANQLNKAILPFSVPFYPMHLLATVTEKILRPMGIQPPIHRRRLDFFKKSFVFSQGDDLLKIGFEPKIGFKEGISKTFKWYEESGYL